MQKENYTEIHKFDVLIDTKTNIVYQELRGFNKKTGYFIRRTPFGFGCHLWDATEIDEKIKKGEFKYYKGEPTLEETYIIVYDEQGKEKRIDVDFSPINSKRCS